MKKAMALAVLFVFLSPFASFAQARYYVTVYRDKDFKHPLMTWEFRGQEEFIAWPDNNERGDKVNDEVSSVEYCLPPDWGLLLFLHRDPMGKDNQMCRGTGRVERVNEGQLRYPDDMSGHKYCHKNGPCGW